MANELSDDNLMFGGLLREHRFAAGFTQEQLAERSGLSVRSIRNLERGLVGRPHRESIMLLATALGLSPMARAELAREGHQRPEQQLSAIPGAESVLPRQLPPAVPHFTGRSAALKTLTDLIADNGAPGQTVVISAIDGTAGVGKTALAVHWAQHVADQFPDGQLYVNLRGFDPGGSPMPSSDAIRQFLIALGVPAAEIPIGLEAQAAQYRSLLSRRRMLVFLDNARDAEQIRPLLPGSPGCLVLVTSRERLLSLIAAEGAHSLTLDLFTMQEARELLTRRLGADRVSREQLAVDELIRLCARLPLALNILAARAIGEPTRALGDLAGQLRGPDRRLDMLDAGDPVTDVRVVFSWSCRHLSAPAARMFRLLGAVHPGPDVSVQAAASLAGVPLRQARQALEELTGSRLLTEHPVGRFSLHDLLCEYAAEQAKILDSGAERAAALRRVLDHYLHTAFRAARLLAPTRDPITVAAPEPGSAPQDFADDAQALAWMEAEYPVLLGVIAAAVESGFDIHAWQLPWGLSDFLDRRGHWQAYAATQNTGLAAAQRLGDSGAQARARAELGYVHGMLGSYRDADKHLRHAEALYRQLGDRGNEVMMNLRLAHLLGWQDRNAEARDHAMRALEISRAEGRPGTCANALNTLGWYTAMLGGHQEALGYCKEALDLLRSLGDRLGQAATLDSLGYVYRHLGEHRRALDCYQQALRLFSDLGDRYKQSEAFTGLGDTHYAAGNVEAAHECWQQALTILADLDHPDAQTLRGRLAQIPALTAQAAAHLKLSCRCSCLPRFPAVAEDQFRLPRDEQPAGDPRLGRYRRGPRRRRRITHISRITRIGGTYGTTSEPHRTPLRALRHGRRPAGCRPYRHDDELGPRRLDRRVHRTSQPCHRLVAVSALYLDLDDGPPLLAERWQPGALLQQRHQ